MNETLFFIHVASVMGFGLAALKMGKNALTSWIALQAVLANLFVIKQICFFSFHITCSDVFAIGSIFGLNLLREYFGKEAVKGALWCCFFTMVFFVTMAKIHLLYSPSPFDTAHQAFQTILSSSARLLFASLGVFVLVQQIEVRFFSFLKEKWTWIPLTIRNALSTSSTQLLDTFLFSVLGLWGLIANLSDIILVSFSLKILIIALMSPLIHFSKRFAPEESYDRI
jgi:queuosine precursor transporter